MKRKVFVLASVIAVAGVIGLLAWLASKPKEPVYDGKPISYWINEPGIYGAQHSPVIFGSLPKIDSNAIPYLVKALHRRDTKLETIYLKLWVKSPDWLKNRLPTPLIRSFIRAHVVIALGNIGPEAKPALPALIQAFRDDDPFVRGFAGNSLVAVGAGDENVKIALTEALTDDDPNIRVAATNALQFFAK